MMQEPKVVHCKKEPFDVYIGRGIRGGEKSKWGNPYSHKDGTLAEFKVDSRKEAIEKFEEYLLSNEELMGKLEELEGKTLGCWCINSNNWNPGDKLKCHGQILQKYFKLKSLGMKYYLEKDYIINLKKSNPLF